MPGLCAKSIGNFGKRRLNGLLVSILTRSREVGKYRMLTRGSIPSQQGLPKAQLGTH